MKKLEVGDYVKNLTKEQFDKLMELQPIGGPKYKYVVGQTDLLYLHENIAGLSFQFVSKINVKLNQPIKQELTYRQFLGRAKKTFGV